MQASEIPPLKQVTTLVKNIPTLAHAACGALAQINVGSEETWQMRREDLPAEFLQIPGLALELLDKV
jgi:hypothetical protein